MTFARNMNGMKHALILANLLHIVLSACVFPDVFKKSSWVDNMKGDVTFTTWEMKGWGFLVGSANISVWEIVDNTRFDKQNDDDTDFGYLALRAREPFDSNGNTYYSFVCLKFSEVSEGIYKYYSLHDEDPIAGGERVKLHGTDDLTKFNDICDTAYAYNEAHYSILVKKGTDPKSTCPNPILARFDYKLEYPNGTMACAGDKDLWDGCKDNTVLEFNYTACGDRIAYSEGGKLSCIVSTEYNTDKDYQILVYNLDETVDNIDTFRFSCIRVTEDGKEMSVAPSYCRSGQTPYNFPQDNGVNIGQKLTTKELVHCRIYPPPGEDDKSLSKGQIIGIAVGSAAGLALILVIVICCCCCRKK